MIVPILRQFAEWLDDGTAGVNAELASLPADVGDAMPPEVVVFEPTRHKWLARGTINRTKTGAGPLLLVEFGASADVPLDPRVGSTGGVPISIRYVARKEATDELYNDAMQTLRAAQRVIAKRFAAVMTTSAVERNQTDIGPPLEAGTLVNQLEQMEGDELIVCRLDITVPAFDAWGLGLTS